MVRGNNMITVFNKNKVDFTKGKMFFGDELNTQRYDTFKYPIFDKLTQSQLGYFWRPEEVSLQKDRNDYNTLTEEQKFIFTSNLKYQTLLDSVQGRGPALSLLPFCSIPELEACIITWDFFETIHSRAYTHMVKNLYSNPEDVLGTILDDKMILERASSITKTYDNFINYGTKYRLGIEIDRIELKKLLWLTLVDINILEGIRFYVSFACTFAFGELKLMEGSSKIISLIARDESQHLAITQNIIKNYKAVEQDDEMRQVIKDTEKEVYLMYENAVNEEKRWANYLFEHGSMVGLNAALLHNYIEWIANRRLRSIGLNPIFSQKGNTNPLPWTQHWLNSKELQNAPQQTQIQSYVVGGIKQDIDSNTFSNFKL
jgi:ribonucleoside-diphosphate reductase beta chain